MFNNTCGELPDGTKIPNGKKKCSQCEGTGKAIANFKCMKCNGAGTVKA